MRSILVTGGSGFFGQAFIKFLLRNPSIERVCVYSRSEHTQATMRASVGPWGLTDALPRLRFFIGDVRDLPRLQRAMQGCDTVVHAAALKRVEVGEYNPDEMIKTNVLGAINVIEAAHNTPSVSKVVALSTDKACAPVNAYGASKLIAEKLFLAANNMTRDHKPVFAVTRYGNVAGSTGSVIPIWKDAVKNLEVLKVTDLKATRFWMTADQACEMVNWLLENMKGGELVIPALPAYRLGSLLRAFNPVQYEEIGLGKEEKLHETMISEDERKGFSWNGRYWIKGAGDFGIPLYTPYSSNVAHLLTVDELRGML